MSIYADTNFFTRLYLRRFETDAAQALLESDRPVLPITWLVRLELINALQQAVFSGLDGVRISSEHAAVAQQTFRDDLRVGLAIRAAGLPLDDIARRFEEVALRHTARHGFRTYDILHVSSALTLNCRTFWSFDKRASKLAKLEGLRII